MMRKRVYRPNLYEFRHVGGHIEVFYDNVFQFSSDTIYEAERDLENIDIDKKYIRSGVCE